MPALIEPALPRDLDAIQGLLVASKLPTDGLADHLTNAFVVRDGQRVVGVAALEMYAGGALLRSVAVDERSRRRGVGRRVMGAVLAHARQLGVPAVYLLTETAEGFFRRFGFERVTREEVPKDVRQSVESVSVCPVSATVMRLTLA